MTRYTFRRARITLDAPSTWRKAPLLKRMLHPRQPELYGPNNEYIGFDSVEKDDAPPTLAEAAIQLRDDIVARGNTLVSASSIVVLGKEHPTAIFDKPMRYAATEMTRLKKYRLFLAGTVYTITARLSFEGSESGGGEPSPFRRGDVLKESSRRITFYSEEGYDKIVKSISIT